MDTRQAIGDFDGPVANHVAFNSTKEFFSVALESGFAVYACSTCELYLEQSLGAGLGAAYMLGTSKIVGLLGGGTRPMFESNKLAIWDLTKEKEVAALTTAGPIISASLSERYIAAVLQKSVNLYEHRPGTITKVGQYDTSDNFNGLCCLGTKKLVLPGRSTGQIQLVDLATLRISIVPAHTTALRALELSPNEEMVASASDTGTLIRLHSTRTCARIAELRRGVVSATIYSLAFSPQSSKLVVTSDTNTLHVFDVPRNRADDQAESRASDNSWQHIDRNPRQSDDTGSSNIQKWSGFGKLPFAPRIFTDFYSFASATFDPGKEDSDKQAAYESRDTQILLGGPPRRHPKGIAGWVDDYTIVVIHAGRNARHERFTLVANDDGAVQCLLAGSSRFLVPN